MSAIGRRLHRVTVRPAPPDVLWACVEDGFHVGSRDGEFLGYIDRQADGAYLACDMRSLPIGTFADPRSAMDAFVSTEVAT